MEFITRRKRHDVIRSFQQNISFINRFVLQVFDKIVIGLLRFKIRFNIIFIRRRFINGENLPDSHTVLCIRIKIAMLTKIRVISSVIIFQQISEHRSVLHIMPVDNRVALQRLGIVAVLLKQ